MASHDPHEDISTHGLADGCERCDEIAGNPIAFLDGENFRALWAKMLEVEFGFYGLDDRVADGSSYRSGNEAKAGKQLYMTAIFVERHTDHDPRTIVSSAGWMT